jgi:single-strand DNA-binding protein
VEKYVHKGSSLYVQGKIRNRSFEGQDGQKRYITEIECEVMQMLDKRQDGNNHSQAQNTAQNPQTASNPYNSSPAPFPPPQAQENGNDDLPF